MASTSHAPPRASRQSPVYLFCLAALSTFLLAVIASGSLLSSYETVGTVVLRWSEGYFAAQPAESQLTHVISRESLLAAAAKLGVNEPDLADLHIKPSHHAGEVRVGIRYLDTDPTRASALVNAVAEQCVAGHQRQAQRHLQKVLSVAREEIERKQQERWRLVEEIERYLKQSLPQLKISQTNWESDPYRKRLRTLAAPPQAAGQGVVLASAESSQLDAAELRTEIAEREARLQKLLEHMTPEHPQVHILRHDIEVLKASLLNVAPHDPPEANAVTPTNGAKSTHSPAATSETAPLNKDEVAFAARMEQYREQLARLNAAHQSLAQTERDAWERYRDLDHAQLAQVEPARRTTRLDRPRWQRFTALMGVLSVSLGLGMVMVAKRGSASFVTPDQARRELPLPVLGVLRRGEADISAGLLAYHVQRGAKVACECLLGGIILWLAMLALLDREFLHELCSDPMAALALAWQRMLG